MKKITRFYRLSLLFIMFFGVSLFLWNCDEEISVEEITQEKTTIKYGVSKETLLNSKNTKRIASRIQESQRNNNLKNRSTAEELTLDELIERLDLEKTYYSLTDSTEVLNAPVRTFGNYKRELLSITKNQVNNSFLITYPNPTDRSLFYVSDLAGNLIQLVQIGNNGIGIVKKFNFSNLSARQSDGIDGCEVTTYYRCSSGNHSFEDQNAQDCIYWNNSTGFPPSVFTIYGCSSAGGGGGPANDDQSGNPTNPSGGISTAPTGNASPPTGLENNCIAGLDCSAMSPASQILISELSLTDTGQISWVNNSDNLVNVINIWNFGETNNWSTDAQNFAEQAIEFLRNNTQYNFTQYENWFNGSSDGIDFFFDESYWNNPSLTFTPQDLPSWDDFNEAYPKNNDGSWMTGADNVFSHVGGDVYQVRLDYPDKTDNVCALKVSIALNGAGINIPQITTTNGNPGTVEGADGNFYFLNAKALNLWMRSTFGTSPSNPNHSHYTASDGGLNGVNYPTLLEGEKGIYSLVSTDPIWASGHADILLDDTTCAAGCHFADAPIDYIDIWVLN